MIPSDDPRQQETIISRNSLRRTGNRSADWLRSARTTTARAANTQQHHADAQQCHQGAEPEEPFQNHKYVVQSL